MTGFLIELRQAALSFEGDNLTRPTAVYDLVEVLEIASHSIVKFMVFTFGLSRTAYPVFAAHVWQVE